MSSWRGGRGAERSRAQRSVLYSVVRPPALARGHASSRSPVPCGATSSGRAPVSLPVWPGGCVDRSGRIAKVRRERRPRSATVTHRSWPPPCVLERCSTKYLRPRELRPTRRSTHRVRVDDEPSSSGLAPPSTANLSRAAIHTCTVCSTQPDAPFPAGAAPANALARLATTSALHVCQRRGSQRERVRKESPRDAS